MFGVWRLGLIGQEHFHQFLGGENVVPARLADSDGVNRPRCW